MMEPFEQTITRILYREPEKFDEFLRLYSELKSKFSIRLRLYELLREALNAQHEPAVDFLLDEIRDCKLSAQRETKTLLVASYVGNIKAIRHLVRMGACVKAYHKHPHNFALAWAAANGQLHAVQELLRLGANAQQCESWAVFVACEAPYKENVAVESVAPIVKVLLDAGANPEPNLNNPQWTALNEALSNEDEETALLLLERGANIRVPSGKTLTWWAYGMQKVMREFIRRGMRGDDIVREDDNHTFLMEAAWNKDAETVKKLLELGANVSAKDDNGMSALDYAIRENVQEVIQILQAHSNKENIETV